MEENKNNDPIQDPASSSEGSSSEPYDTYPTEDSYSDQLRTEETAAAATETTTTKSQHQKSSRDPERRMPFLEHLEELRWTLVRSLLAVTVGAILAYIYSKEIVDFLHRPAPDVKLIFLSPTGAFMTYIKVAMYSGLVISMPYVAWEFWRFIVPGLLSKEKRLVPPIVFFTVVCFLLGAAFAYFVIIPFGLQFLIGGFQTDYLTANITINDYLGFVVTMILVFGVVFELPVLAYFLSLIGLLTPEFLRSKRRYGIVVIFIVAAILTPPDAFTQTMLALPLLVLYEISIWVSAGVRRSKLRKAKAEASQN
jgi:sec-independent protein translocase protein TatC